MSQCTAELNGEHCQRPTKAKGFCSMHYGQTHNHGAIRNIHPVKRFNGRTTPPAFKRFARKIRAGGHDLQCWEWNGAKSRNGYGTFDDNGTVNAHKWAWRWLVGDIPEGMELDHICRNRLCVRPSHLQVVTHAEHSALGVKQRSLLKANEDSILVGGNRKARGIQELSYAMEHGLPCVFDGAKVAR